MSLHNSACRCLVWANTPFWMGAWVGGAGRGQPLLESTRPQHYFVLVGRCLEQLDSGLVSNHQRVLAQREALWASHTAGPGTLGGADCWPWSKPDFHPPLSQGCRQIQVPREGPTSELHRQETIAWREERMRGHIQSAGDSHIHVGLRLRHHSEKLSPLLSES